MIRLFTILVFFFFFTPNAQAITNTCLDNNGELTVCPKDYDAQGIKSIEWIVDSSDVIIQCKANDIFFINEEAFSSDWSAVEASCNKPSNLKGVPPKKFKFERPKLASSLRRYLANSTCSDFLLTFNEMGSNKVQEMFCLNPTDSIYMGNPDKAITMNFKMLKSKDDILNAINKRIQFNDVVNKIASEQSLFSPPVRGNLEVDIPKIDTPEWNDFGVEKWAFSPWLHVPNDKDIHRFLLEVVKSADIQSPTRALAIRQLAMFPGEKTTDTLKQILEEQDDRSSIKEAASDVLDQIEGQEEITYHEIEGQKTEIEYWGWN